MTKPAQKVTKVMRTMFTKNNMSLKEATFRIKQLCESEEYIEKTGDEATVPLNTLAISGWRTGRLNLRNAQVYSIVRFCNGIGCTPNDIIENPLSPDGNW